jgi:hypothetical protein
LHDTAYYIFLKSLRSLEEFRKNPHLKIPPKSSCANFQSLGKLKNLIFIRKRIFLRFQPNRPGGQPARPASQPSQPSAFSPVGHERARPIPACAAVASWPKYVSFFTLRNPATTPSPSVTAQWGPPVSSIFHLTLADPGHVATSLSHPAPPRLYLEMPSQAINFPALIPRVNPSLTTLPAFNGVNTIYTTGYRPLPPLRCSPGPYINPQGPPATPTPPPLALELSLALLCSRVELTSRPKLRRQCVASSPSSRLR